MLEIRAVGKLRGKGRHLGLLAGLLLLLPCLAFAAGREANERPPATFVAAETASDLGVSAVVVTPETAPYEELLLEATVNGLPPPVTLIALRDEQDRLWIPGENFRFWDMQPPAAVMDLQGRDFRLLDGQPGLSYSLDMSRLTLDIVARPEWFTASRIDSHAGGLRAVPKADPGGFLNYDFNVTHSDSDTMTAGLLEAGVFNGFGVVTSTMLARSHPFDAGDNLVRLDTTWTRDLPEHLSSLRVGDAIGGASAWGRPVRFGGVQFATNFATQPGFITFPLPLLQGEAVLPSTLELYVNGIRRMTSEVPTGPFEIPDLPAVTGHGQVQLIVTDLLGRQQILTDSFYVSSRLLQEGLHDFSYEIGAEREAYAVESFDYGRAIAVGTHRYGFSNVFTGEARVEVSSGQYTGGVGGVLLIGDYGVARGSVAGSHGERGLGALATLGFEHSSRRFGFGFNLELASEDFRQIGLRDGQLAPRSRGQAFVSVPLKRAGSISLSYVRRDERDTDLGRFESLNASYQVSLGRVGHLGMFASRIEGMQDDIIVGINFSRAIGDSTISSANGSFSNDSDELVMQIQRSLPYGPGLGYHARVGLLDQERFDLGFAAQTSAGTWQLEASQASGQTRIRASASGGIAWLDGAMHLSRRLQDSFAIVDVGDFTNVRIYADNQHVATTGVHGRALVPRLRAYEENPVRIEVRDLPIDANVEQIEYRAVPYFRSGMVIEFPVSRSRSATFRLRRANGEPVPAGSIISSPDGRRFPVGYDGEAFITAIESGSPLTARWNDNACDFRLTLPENDEPLPDLGTVSCVKSTP